MVRFLTHNLNRLSWKLVAFSTFHIPYIVPDFQLFFFLYGENIYLWHFCYCTLCYKYNFGNNNFVNQIID